MNNMKNILLLLAFITLGNLSAQMSNNEISKDDFDLVQKVLYQKPIHIHAENDGFYLCWEGKRTRYVITKNGKPFMTGKTKKELFVSTKEWENGTYAIEIKNNVEYVVMMRNKEQ